MSRGGSLIELPVAPVTGSHVPELTSIHGSKGRGPYGSAKYRGNCGGYLIRDLLRYFQSRSCLDLFAGSGTCGDVCRELSIPYSEVDIKLGLDAASPASYAGLQNVDFVWGHPPYWRQIVYNDHPDCLSRLHTLEAFLDRMQLILRLSKSVLSERGRIAILIGGYSDQGRYQPLPQLLVGRAIREGLSMACTEIIRLQHGNTSSRREYKSSFIPGLHDTCLIFEAHLPTKGTHHD